MTMPLSPNTSYSTGTPIASQDLNDCQKYTSALYPSRFEWIDPFKTSFAFNFQPTNGSNVLYQNCTSVTGTPQLVYGLPLQHRTNSIYQQLTAVSIRVTQAGASGMTLRIDKVSGLSTTGGAPTGTVGTGGLITTGPASSGEKIITLSGVTIGNVDDSLYWITVLGATIGDKLYGLKLTWDASLWL